MDYFATVKGRRYHAHRECKHLHANRSEDVFRIEVGPPTGYFTDGRARHMTVPELDMPLGRVPCAFCHRKDEDE